MNLEALQVARHVIGVKQVTKALKRGSAACVFVAGDAEQAIVASIVEMAEAGGVELQTVASMKELGAACGIEVGAAAAAALK